MKKKIALVLTGAMMFGSITVPVSAEESVSPSFDAEAFANPDNSYKPGVRWWWPGGAVDKETLQSEIDYLAEKGFGSVEINPFYVSTILEGDEERVSSIYTPEFYELLDYAITACEEKGIAVDLNMGSGWNANSADVTYDESMGNMALGRVTLTADEAKASIEIPAAERSYFYTAESGKGEWQDESVVLQGVLVGELTGELGTDLEEAMALFGPKPSYEEVYDADGNVVKSYDTQVVLNPDNSYFISADDVQISDGVLTLSEEITANLDSSKNYEIVAMYSVPSGGLAIDAANAWYTVDHMDADKVIDYMNDWLGNENLSAILASHSNIRSLFNDSYEFYSDIYYTESMAELAADSENNGLGYDFSKYLPTIYKQYSAAPYYMGLGSLDTYLTYTLDADEEARIQYDYNLLVNEKFQEGMAAFQSASNEVGLQYRQQAYNPPIDTIGSAEYIDVPDTEQANEYDLIRASSGSHLYGKDVTTAEQYTLGCTPLTNSLEQVKIGYDIMATSGVNNFFYHGFMYGYGVDSEEYGELGWAPFPSIGINVSERNTLSEYFDEMNAYASRLNYLMQQGTISKDVAYYMSFNGSLSETEAVSAMNQNGIAWDAINDDSIVDEATTVVDGQISVNGGTIVYDAIVVDVDSVPVATLEKLQALAEDGASIIFYGAAPTRQPGYADGNYEEADAQAAAAAQNAVAAGAVVAADTASFTAALSEMVTPEVSYTENANVRFIRRTLEDGSELVYLRNISSDANTITITLAEGYGDCYWLDQNTGEIYAAQRDEDGNITITMDASLETLSGSNSMGIALLCEKEGVSLDSASVTEGTPTVLDQAETVAVKEVSIDTLTVGENVYTGLVLGKWNSDSFLDGALKNSDETGVYTGSVSLSALSEGQRAYLVLDQLYTAATVTVNGTEIGDVLFAPYEIEITDALADGDNTVEIQVVPKKYNKVNSDLTTEELQDTGLAGSVSIEIR